MSGMAPPPPPIRLAISAGLLGAVLLARGRAAGMALMEPTGEGARRSFAAAAICLPAFLVLRLWSNLPEELSDRALVAELVGYVLGWVVFALASLPLVQGWGKGGLWPRFLAAWNWTSVVQYAVQLVVMLPGALGLISGGMAQGLTLAAMGYLVWLEWFVARTALGVSGARAAGLVAMDLTIGIFIASLVQRAGSG